MRIGGIMRNDQGEMKVTFSKPIGSLYSTLAAREALMIFFNTERRQDYSLIIESDSSKSEVVTNFLIQHLGD